MEAAWDLRVENTGKRGRAKKTFHNPSVCLLSAAMPTWRATSEKGQTCRKSSLSSGKNVEATVRVANGEWPFARGAKN